VSEQKTSFIDISGLLSKPPRSRVDLIGVELEGGWVKLPKGTEKLTPDGSVQIDADINDGYTVNGVRHRVLHIGEIVSPPMPQSMLNAWLTQHYPQAVNRTCGLHLHMSFKSPLIYQRLMDETYQKTVIEFTKRWAKDQVAAGKIKSNDPLFERLSGNAQYCQDQFWADSQAAQTSKSYNRNRPGHRYTAVNYCYGLHQTVEIRLLGMFPEASLAEAALNNLILITNCWLVAGRKIPKLDQSWKLEEDRISEERIECV
jgi:hypothetical protein